MGKKKEPTQNNENIALDAEKQDEFNKDLEGIGDEEIEFGTIYVGHLPRGFYEDQLRQYFSQFGTVSKVRLARSKKTGGYKGYGYVQFTNQDVAKIAADAMNNYLMFDRLLKCQYVESTALHPDIWKGCNKKFIWVNRVKRHKKQFNRSRSEDQLKKVAKKLIAKDNRRRKVIMENGIEYEFPGFAGAMKIKKTTVNKTKSTGKTPLKKKIVEKTTTGKTPTVKVSTGKTPAVKTPSAKTPSAKKLSKKTPSKKVTKKIPAE